MSFQVKSAAWLDIFCADLASIWDLPVVKGKTRLNVLVMFTPQFHSFGPHSFNPKYVWKYYHLGTADPQKIDLVKIGYDKESFV